MPPKKAAKGSGSIDAEKRSKPAARPTTAGRKRKAAPEEEDGAAKSTKARKTQKKEPSSKQTKQTQISTESADKLEKPILINRAPVLELWGACVASVLHPDLSWNLCLSIGSSISTITAIAKGRSIGKISQPDPDKKKDETDKGTKGEFTLEVMGFPMTIEGDAVIVKGKPRTTREANLIRKYGEKDFSRVKSTMLEALKSWQGDEKELDSQAFHMYEQFRPNVAKGQQGWGRKGELSLSKIEDVVQK